MIKKTLDILIASIALIIFLLPIIFIAICVFTTSRGPVLYWSDRVGRNNVIFQMPKFRSMLVGSPVVETNLLKKPDTYLSPIGGFIRRYSLDEIPQLYSIIKGDMSIVGPRPALFSQYDLINLRTEKGIDKLLPGVTGLAQIKGRDKLSIEEKVKLDEEYMVQRSLFLDIKIVFVTIIKVFNNADVSH